MTVHRHENSQTRQFTDTCLFRIITIVTNWRDSGLLGEESMISECIERKWSGGGERGMRGSEGKENKNNLVSNVLFYLF